MSMTDSYSFALYEENGKVMLHADFYSYETDEKYTFIKETSTDSMEELLDIVNTYDLITYVRKYKKKKPMFQVLDGTDYYLTLKMSDGSSKSIDSAGDARGALYDFFTTLTIKTAGTNNSEQPD